MQIKSIVAAAAIALVATVGSASAADQFSTLEGITADAMAPQEMGGVTGAAAGTRLLITGGFTFAGGDGSCGAGCHAFHFPVDAGAAMVVSTLPGGIEPAGGSSTNTFVP